MCFAVPVSLSASALAGEPRVHDGLHLRLGGGIGHFSADAETSDIWGSAAEGTITSTTLALELAVGGSLGGGFFLGGGFYPYFGLNPQAEDARWQNDRADVSFDSASLYILGPMADYYVGPEGGLHLQASVGLAFLEVGQGEISTPLLLYRPRFPSQSGTGFAWIVGVGYELWAGDDFSMGLLARVLFGMANTESDDDIKLKSTIVSPALLLTATLN